MNSESSRRDLLKAGVELYEMNKKMTIESNGGSLTMTKKAYYHNYGEVWFHEDAITNVLCLKNVIKKGFCIMYDSKDTKGFVVHKKNGKLKCFLMHKNGLHYFECKKQHMSVSVKDTSKGSSQQQVTKVKEA